MKRCIRVTAAILLCVLLLSCQKRVEQAAPTQAISKITIGVTVQDSSNEFITMLQEGLLKRAQAYPNVKLIIEDAEAKPYKQIVQMATFIAQRVDVIIINPADATMLIPAIEDAIREGIPVITLSSDVNEEVGQIRAGSNNVEAGKLQATHLIEQLGGIGKLLILKGPVGHIATTGRSEGYQQVFEQYKGVSIVHEETGNWQREQAMSIVQKCIQAGIVFDAVLAQNDAMALGALQAIEHSHLQGKAAVCGIDAIEEALAAVKQGKLAFTCFQDAQGQAYGAIDLAIKAVEHKPLEDVLIPFSLVTKDNVETYFDKVIATNN